MRMLIAILLLAFCTGCATTLTSGTYIPDTNEIKFKSYTSAVGGAAIKNSKTIYMNIEQDPDGFMLHAEGKGEADATSPDINALAQAIAAGIATALAP